MNSQRAIGTIVLAGMVTATVLAVFAIPLFYVLIARTFGAHQARVAEEVPVDVDAPLAMAYRRPEVGFERSGPGPERSRDRQSSAVRYSGWPATLPPLQPDLGPAIRMHAMVAKNLWSAAGGVQTAPGRAIVISWFP
ncbi:hypothetical protein [Methylobacterium sp.]|uniref:hypothetical protein n=1 Tax=Methylobacterium sp. TaxID=409 RepID=UPI003B5B9716